MTMPIGRLLLLAALAPSLSACDSPTDLDDPSFRAGDATHPDALPAPSDTLHCFGWCDADHGVVRCEFEVGEESIRVRMPDETDHEHPLLFAVGEQFSVQDDREGDVALICSGEGDWVTVPPADTDDGPDDPCVADAPTCWVDCDMTGWAESLRCTLELADAAQLESFEVFAPPGGPLEEEDLAGGAICDAEDSQTWRAFGGNAELPISLDGEQVTAVCGASGWTVP